MLFNSLSFLIFFSIFFPAYWLSHRIIPARNALILIASYIFYGAWDWRFLSLIITSTIVDYLCGLKIHASTNTRHRKILLTISILVNIGILATFKYFDFFVSSFIDLLGIVGIEGNFHTLHIILPVGISFYTFQTLSYTIDIYRKEMVPTKNLLNFSSFVAFFPQLVAGPIERAKSLLPQLEGPTKFSITDVRDGSLLVLWGLFKKVIIADRLATYVDTVFASPDTFSSAVSLIAVLLFSIQIYCDFSGYSDIARGLSKMLGINIMINFRTPYFATSIQDFWRRWHISLSTWFRDYVFIPLGGSRSGPVITKRNILATFVLSGLWHGANYTFIIWGAIHAIGYLLDPFIRLAAHSNLIANRICMVARWLFTFIFVQFAWIFFRSENMSSALLMINKIISPNQWNNAQFSISNISVGMNYTELVISAFLVLFLLSFDWFLGRDALEDVINRYRAFVRWLISFTLISGFLLLAPSESGSFIYFQF